MPRTTIIPAGSQRYCLLLLAIAIIVPMTISCLSSPQANVTSHTAPTPASTPTASPVGSTSACQRIAEIKILPFKQEPVDDPVFNALMAEGERALPCLIEKITDPTRMPDPRQAPKVDGTKVGDVAYFILVRIAKLNFEEYLPPAVLAAYRENGIYGYFEQIDEANNRVKLQKNLQKWYERKDWN